MSIQATVRDKLLAYSTLTDIISTKLYYRRAVQSVTMPYVVFQIISNPSQKIYMGKDGENPIFSFKIVSDDSTEIDSIYFAIRDILDCKTDTDIFYSKQISSIDLDNETNEGYFVRVVDYEIKYLL